MRTICFAPALMLLFALTGSGQQLRVESFEGRDVAADEILVKFRNVGGPQAMAIASGDPDILSSAQVGRTGVVRLRSRGRRVEALLRAYRQRLDVLYAEPNYILHATDFPNDEFVGGQWALRNTGQEIEGHAGTPGADIGVVQAWNITEGSRSVVVGVVDGGIDYSHPDLAANVWSAPAPFSVVIGGKTINCAAGTHGFNAIEQTCDPLDKTGHGTHVAGIIGAVGNNGFGVSGVARTASIMGLKFIGDAGFGTTADAIAALEFAVQVKSVFPLAANVRILNNSWGKGTFSQALLDEVSLTNANDMLFVASAGNESLNNDLMPSYPANFDVSNVVSVAATDNLDKLAEFSNWGPSTVHLGAPGVSILSTFPNGPFQYDDGTSMSAPMVSGAAALILSACPLATPALKAVLLDNADPVPSLEGRTITGRRLNAFRPLMACLGTIPGFDLTVSPGTRQLELMQPSEFEVRVVATNGFSGSVDLVLLNVPAGITATLSTPSMQGSGTSTLTLTAGNAVEAGTYLIGIRATSGSVQRTAGVAVTVGFPIASGQTISGELTMLDAPSPEAADKYGDLFKLTLTATTEVTIDLNSRKFNAYLYVRSSTGDVLYSDDDTGGHHNSRIQATLAAGTYSIEVTTAETNEVGRYTLSINTPTLSDIKTYAAAPNSVVNVTLTGNRFTSPMTINAGAGITVSNVNVVNSTIATATLTVGANAATTPRDLTVQTGEGVSNPLSFTVTPSLNFGQRIGGTLSETDHLLVNRDPSRYVDIYQLTLSTSVALSIDVYSRDFDTYLYVISSSGDVLSQNDAFRPTGDFGPSRSRVSTTLGGGTYFIEVTSNEKLEKGDYFLSLNTPALYDMVPPFLIVGSANVSVTLRGSRLSGLQRIDAGEGVTGSNFTTVGGDSRLDGTFTVSANATPGRRNVTVTTSEGTSNPFTFVLLPAAPVVSSGSRVLGTLAPTDGESVVLPGSHADLYRITTTQNTLAIDLVTTAFQGHLAILSSSGQVLAESDDLDGSGTTQLLFESAPFGTYFVEVSSSEPTGSGSYTLGFDTVLIKSITPNLGFQGSSVDLSFSGFFLSTPMTINPGPGISVTSQSVSVNPLGTGTGTARLAISPGASLGPRLIYFTTANGTDFLTFHVLPSPNVILVGQAVTGTLSGADQSAVSYRPAYADYYNLIVTGAPAVVELTSSDFEVSLMEIGHAGEVVSEARGPLARLSGLTIGTHLIEVSSVSPAIGSYTLSVPAPPLLNAITPAVGSQGSVLGVVLTGSNFSSSLTLASSPSGMTFRDIAVYSSTMATAVVSIPASMPVGAKNISVTTGGGTSPAVTFNVVQPGPVAVPASRLSFTKFFAAGELGGAGFAVVNPGPTPAEVRFSMYNAFGMLKGFYTETVSARGQTARVGNALFPAASEPGWVEVTSATPGLQGFWLGGDFTNVMDGADSAVRARDLTFSLVTPTTEIHIVGSAAANLTIRIYDADGNELAVPVLLSVVTNGGFQSAVNQLFPSVNLSQARYIRVSASADIMGTTVTKDYPVAPSWAVLNGIDSSVTATEANFPHVPTGSGWSTIAGITNLSTGPQALTFTFFPDQGSPVSVTRNVPARGAIRESVGELFAFDGTYREGWVKVTGTQPLTGFIVYGYSTTGGAAAVPVQATPLTSMIFSHVATGPQFETGIGLLNATTRDANVEVYVMRRTGELVGGAADVLTASFTLGAGKKTARLLDVLVPASIYDDGFVFVRSTNNVPLYALQVFFTRDVKAISHVPAGILDPALGYAPPPPQIPLPPMTIFGLNQSAAPPGSVITINGAGFDPTAASNTVVFMTATAQVAVPATSATPAALTVTVPNNAVTGPVFFTTGGRFSNSVTLTVP